MYIQALERYRHKGNIQQTDYLEVIKDVSVSLQVHMIFRSFPFLLWY